MISMQQRVTYCLTFLIFVHFHQRIPFSSYAFFVTLSKNDFMKNTLKLHINILFYKYFTKFIKNGLLFVVRKIL